MICEIKHWVRLGLQRLANWTLPYPLKISVTNFWKYVVCKLHYDIQCMWWLNIAFSSGSTYHCSSAQCMALTVLLKLTLAMKWHWQSWWWHWSQLYQLWAHNSQWSCHENTRSHTLLYIGLLGHDLMGWFFKAGEITTHCPMWQNEKRK